MVLKLVQQSDFAFIVGWAVTEQRFKWSSQQEDPTRWGCLLLSRATGTFSHCQQGDAPHVPAYFCTSVSKWVFVLKEQASQWGQCSKSESPDECRKENFECQETMFLAHQEECSSLSIKDAGKGPWECSAGGEGSKRVQSGSSNSGRVQSDLWPHVRRWFHQTFVGPSGRDLCSL